MDEDQGAADVVAMQFAAGMSIARLANDWERDPAWVEQAVRRALLNRIPPRDGGTKITRREHDRLAKLFVEEEDLQEKLWP